MIYANFLEKKCVFLRFDIFMIFTSTLLHYYKKKCVEGYFAYKKNIFIIIYNYILP